LYRTDKKTLMNMTSKNLSRFFKRKTVKLFGILGGEIETWLTTTPTPDDERRRSIETEFVVKLTIVYQEINLMRTAPKS
jgi:hypothetical protein